MFKKFLKLLNLLLKNKIIFDNPPKEKILVFDNTSVFDLKNVLKNRKYFVLNTRETEVNEVYISFIIFFYFIKYIRINLYTSYLISIIKVVNPKVVITVIDNSYKFSEIAKILNSEKIKFIAIQNAARYDFAENNLRFKKKLIIENLNKKFYIPHFFCFGDYVKKYYKKYKINVKKFYTYGSLRLSNYFQHLKDKKIKIRKNFYDVSFISGWAKNKDIEFGEKGIDYAWAKMCIYTIDYCIKNNLKFLFISKSTNNVNKKKEFDFFKKYLNKNQFNFLKKNSMKVNHKNFNSYKAIHESKVVTGVVSTMLQDKLALGGKILVCNFTKIKEFNFPIRNFCFLERPSYKKFKERLDFILKINIKTYNNYLKNSKLIYFDKKNLTFNLINKHLDNLLNS